MMQSSELVAAQETAKRLAGDGPIEWGWYQFCEDLYADADLDPMPAWWARHYRAFAESGAPEFVAGKGTRGGGSTNWVAWEVPQLVFSEKTANESVELILPVMAATVGQANGRALNFQQRLAAIGYQRLAQRARAGERSDGSSTEKPRVGEWQFWASQPSANGINTIEFRDFRGRLVTVRTACASISAASEMTCPDVFGDEVAQWGKDARQVLTLLRNRLKGQRPGKSYLISQPLPDTEFYEICRAGSNENRYVCTLGADGVDADRIARMWLKRKAEAMALRGGAEGQFYARLAEDPRVTQDLTPDCPWNPAWAILPVGVGRDDVGPEAAMRECCSHALKDIGRADGLDPLEQLWWGFGGRPMSAGKHAWIDAQLTDACLR